MATAALASVAHSQTLSFTQNYAPLVDVTSSWDMIEPVFGGFYAAQVSSEQVILARYDEIGNQLAIRRIDTPYGTGPQSFKMARTPAGNLWVAFTSETSRTDDTYAMKLSPSLATLAQAQYDSGANDLLTAMAVGPGEELSLFNRYRTTDFQTGFARYDGTGGLISVGFLEGPPNEEIFTAYTHTDGFTYAAGRSGSNAAIYRFNPTTGAVTHSYFRPVDSVGGNDVVGTYTQILPHPTNGNLYVYGYAALNWHCTRFDLNLNLVTGSILFGSFAFVGAGFSPGGRPVVTIIGSEGRSVHFNEDFLDPSTQLNIGAPDRGTAFALDRSHMLVARDDAPVGGLKAVGSIWWWPSSTTLQQRVVSQVPDVNWQGSSLAPLFSGGNVHGGRTTINGLSYSALLTFNDQGALLTREIDRFQGNKRRKPMETVVDNANNRYVLSDSGQDTQVVKFSATGAVLWDVVLPGVSSEQIAIGPDQQPVVLALEPFGAILTLYKLTATTGTTVWSRDLQEIKDTTVNELVCGPDGEIVMAGAVNRSGGFGFDAIVAKFAANGTFLWRRYAALGVGFDVWYGLAVPNSKYVVVSGVGTDADAKHRVMVYDPNGNVHWDQTFGTSGAGLSKIALQSSGLVGLVMRSQVGGNYQLRVVRQDPVRKITFFNTVLNGSTSEMSFATAMSPAGTLYVGQSSATSRGLIQYGSNGAVAWVRTLPSGVSTVVDVETDAQNSVYILGEENFTDTQTGTTKGMVWTKYNTLGNLITQQRIRGEGPGLDARPTDIHIGKAFDPWVTGGIRALGRANQISVSRYLQPVAPTVAGETYNVAAGQTLTVAAPGVMANDVDLNGDTITASLVSNPSAGTLSLAGTGAFTYVAPATTGARTFTYRVTDSTGRSTNGVATINVN